MARCLARRFSNAAQESSTAAQAQQASSEPVERCSPHMSVSTADRRKNARATVRLRRARGMSSIKGKSREVPPVAVLRGFSGGVGQLLPVAGGQLDELAAQRLELGGTIVVLDVLREV